MIESMANAKKRQPFGPNPHRFTGEQVRQWNRERRAKSKAIPVGSQPADFVGHLPSVLQSAGRTLLPRILANEVEFRSSILDRIAFMEGCIVEALDARAYTVELASLPTLLREWRQCLELSLRIVEKTKGLDTGDAATAQVSGLLAREALLRHELTRLGVIDSSGRILTGLEATRTDSSPATMPERRTGSARALRAPVGRRAPRLAPGPSRYGGRARAAGAEDAASEGGGMTTGSLSAGRTDDRPDTREGPTVPTTDSPGGSGG